MVLKSGIFLVEHIYWRSNTWAGSLIWIQSIAFIAITKVGSAVAHTDLLTVMGSKCTHICSYKEHLQKRNFSHSKGKKQSLIIYAHKSISCTVCWISSSKRQCGGTVTESYRHLLHHSIARRKRSWLTLEQLRWNNTTPEVAKSQDGLKRLQQREILSIL